MLQLMLIKGKKCMAANFLFYFFSCFFWGKFVRKLLKIQLKDYLGIIDSSMNCYRLQFGLSKIFGFSFDLLSWEILINFEEFLPFNFQYKFCVSFRNSRKICK
jgi:hypothetical protein